MRVCETFYSLQGEGVLMGAPTLFIRFVGCNLDCEWCDTRYAREGGKEMKVGEIVEEARRQGVRVCLTGGEPLLQSDLPELVRALVEEGLQVSVETNGSMDVSVIPDHPSVIISMDIKCPSSGMEGRMRMGNIPLLKEKDQLKFVVADRFDYEFAKGVVGSYTPRCTVILTPVGGLELRPLAERVLDDRLDVRVLPQLHKLIWGERRGV